MSVKFRFEISRYCKKLLRYTFCLILYIVSSVNLKVCCISSRILEEIFSWFYANDVTRIPDFFLVEMAQISISAGAPPQTRYKTRRSKGPANRLFRPLALDTGRCLQQDFELKAPGFPSTLSFSFTRATQFSNCLGTLCPQVITCRPSLREANIFQHA